MFSEDSQSHQVRMAVFEWLKNATAMGATEFSRDELEAGILVAGTRVILVGPQGIFKPAAMSYYPLSITTTTSGPYKDAFSLTNDFLLYKYRGKDPNFHENRKLRDTMEAGIPLVYFHSTVPGKYIAIWPVYVVGDSPETLTFTVAADDAASLKYQRDDEDPSIRRAYVTCQVRQRIHQETFRERVLLAYQNRCTICSLRHRNLLEAAHIIPDSEPEGEPIVSNGLSLCKLHHAGYDRLFFGIRPDYKIVVKRRIMKERDGPMLRYGLQEIHDQSIVVPHRQNLKPDAERLEVRYQRFRDSEE